MQASIAIAIPVPLGSLSRIPVHAAIGSAVVFVVNGRLVLYVFNFDRKIKQERR
jgi:hypothetical protein